MKAEFSVPTNLHTGDVISPEAWATHIGEEIPVKNEKGIVIGKATIIRDELGYRFSVDLDGLRTGLNVWGGSWRDYCGFDSKERE